MVLHDYLKIIWDPNAYLDLDDSIIHEVRISEDKALEKARKLVERFDRR